ncbi:MAG: hypothetical protein KC931_27435, partial [Candidatus Omnitrophica bacterium]|nr:hypothetical protein [Candidatus Omnitrophota bacterium]
MGEYGFCRGILAFAVTALLVTPGVIAETPQVVSVNSTVADSGWSAPQQGADVYSDLGYAEASSDWSSDTSTVAQGGQDQNYWVAENPGDDAGSAMVAEDTRGGLGIDVTLDWTSKYMFRGFDVLDDSGAFQPSVEFSLWDSG